jgi:hypothetical protein
MDKIKEIRNKARTYYLDTQSILTIKSLEGGIWDRVDDKMKTQTLQAIQKGRFEKAKYEEIIALEKAGYIVVRGLTLQEWQHYFCDIADNNKYSMSTKKNIYFNDKYFLNKDQHNKLVTVLVYSNKYKFTEEQLFQRDYKFPPFTDLE